MAEKILIVDDEVDTLRLVGLMLERQGYEIVAAENGEQALEEVEKGKPDLILLDVMMPGMDGFEVARQIRGNSETEDIPIIMFTAKVQVEDKVTGLESGADVYLTKPTQPRELFAQVKVLLARSKKSLTTPLPKDSDRGILLGVLSAKGGLGVSSLVINLGIAMYRITDKEVLIADFRPGSSDISMDLGYISPEGLSRLLELEPKNIKAEDVENEILIHATGVRLLLSSQHPVDAVQMTKVDSFKAIAKHLPYLADYTIIDLGSSFYVANQTLAKLCDEILIVVEPSPMNIRQTKVLIEDLYSLGIGEGRMRITLINRVRSSLQLNWSQVQEQLGKKIDTVFTPAPELAFQASVSNTPMMVQQAGSITAQQFEKLATTITQLSNR
jgi:CheY-like chemotaxis protein/MinD-like ATPase involved in chromosome partitioning or flagellar assembly